MSTRKTHGRRRAAAVRTSALATISNPASDNAGGVCRQCAEIAAASVLLLTSGFAAQAGEAPVRRDAAPTANLKVASQAAATLNAGMRQNFLQAGCLNGPGLYRACTASVCRGRRRQDLVLR